MTRAYFSLNGRHLVTSASTLQYMPLAPLNFFCAGILKLALGAALDMVEGVVCGAVGAGCWGLWRGCWAGVSGVPWGWVLGAAEGAIGGVVGVPQGEGAGGRGGGVWWGGTGRRGGGCWGLRWARWRRSAGAVGVGAGGRGEGGGGGQRGAVGVGAGSRGEAGRVRQTASINTPGPPPAMAYGGLPFLGTGCSVLDVVNILLTMKCLTYGLLSLYYSISQECFCPRTFQLKPGLE